MRLLSTWLFVFVLSYGPTVTLTFICASTAGVLPGLPHQKGLRGDRAEHLPPQPRVRRHVLGAEVGVGGAR